MRQMIGVGQKRVNKHLEKAKSGFLGGRCHVRNPNEQGRILIARGPRQIQRGDFPLPKKLDIQIKIMNLNMECSHKH